MIETQTKLTRDNIINTIKVLKHEIKVNGKYIRTRYSKGGLIERFPKETITVYAKGYCDKLLIELSPLNDSDSMTDYFETDRTRILPSHPLYNEFLKYC